jgi:hypothetical protein
MTVARTARKPRRHVRTFLTRERRDSGLIAPRSARVSSR